MPVAATDPLYVLYTSGTTGKPKGIVRDNGGHAVALLWSMRHIYDIAPGDVFWAASDVGWVVGHSYIVYAPLLARRDDGALRGQAGRHTRPGRVLAGGRRARREGAVHRADGDPGDPQGGSRGAHLGRYDLSALKYLFLAGERLDPDTYHGRRRSSASRSSTTGGRPRPGGRSPPIRWACEQLPIKAGSPTVPMPGYDVHILHDDGYGCDAGRGGRDLHPAAAAAGHAADAVGRRRPLRGVLSVRASRATT